MAPSFLGKLRRRRRRDDNNIVEPSPHPEVSKMRGSTQALPLLSTQNINPENNRHADAYKTEKYDALCRLHAQPANASKTDADESPRDTHAFIEPGVDPSDQEPAFTWQDIEPRADPNPPPILEYFNYELSPTEKDNLLYMETQRQTSARSAGTIVHLSTVPEARELRSALERAVQARMLGGAVIVNHEGLPHFLSPQEEEERQVSLRRAVEERMLGLPRRTTFTWAQSHGPSLPSYSPERYN
ncbi:uncharacterized protein P174DRAFT_439981 [Aspergillus novofumigatus IBT 16806]|uniref:Uncharacterized protein n=1 Tax=Aspergillus novofumigatus (strain IBT 16806) TaxID=1392255 RepID=A0A2I1CCL5_ASPN1|nr:uncharacterized protein P174DRAFT_439981 [Aspergillus novofumigatus IBT 16806]PKX95370.1 hypothetical protein P174DRAFT_439981 [Aspergillus novofumigatus IBT 16806]